MLPALCRCIALYPDSLAFFSACCASSRESNGVVCTDLQAPPPANAMEMPAALSLLGISVIRTTSYWPKANQALSTFPPSFSTADLTTLHIKWRFFGRTRRSHALKGHEWQGVLQAVQFRKRSAENGVMSYSGLFPAMTCAITYAVMGARRMPSRKCPVATK